MAGYFETGIRGIKRAVDSLSGGKGLAERAKSADDDYRARQRAELDAIDGGSSQKDEIRIERNGRVPGKRNEYTD